jgi:hypothetical protein
VFISPVKFLRVRIPIVSGNQQYGSIEIGITSIVQKHRPQPRILTPDSKQ